MLRSNDMTRKGIRQQNAERRLSHARWADAPRVTPGVKLLILCVAAITIAIALGG